jgi:hypothetical protein
MVLIPMAGFGESEREAQFGARNAKPGEWYTYALLGEPGHCFGRYRNMDEHDSVVYFDRAPVEMYDETGSRWVIKDGEIGLPLHQFKTFFPSTIDQAERAVSLRNWHRQYLGTWVGIHGAITALGKPCKVFGSTFHLLPYVSFFDKSKIVRDGKEQIVFFTPPSTIEAITEETLQEYLGVSKSRKSRKR